MEERKRKRKNEGGIKKRAVNKSQGKKEGRKKIDGKRLRRKNIIREDKVKARKERTVKSDKE